MLWPTAAITLWLLNRVDAIGNLDVPPIFDGANSEHLGERLNSKFSRR